MISRRDFLMSAGVAAFGAPLHAFQARLATGRAVMGVGYGPLSPVADMNTGLQLLELPRGFRYTTMGWARDLMTDGTPIPNRHDGMAAFAAKGDRVALVRNHEVFIARNGQKTPPFGSNAYDPECGGGTTTLVFDPQSEKMVSVWASLSGTLVNCAGGPTPWGSWLSCEEVLLDPVRTPAATKPHGYVFEVPHDGVSDAKPILGMGRFWHEAVAVDPTTGIVYQTEDRGGAPLYGEYEVVDNYAGGLYRFIPRSKGKLAEGGTLQMLAVSGKPKLDTRTGQRRDTTYDVEWIDIPEPDGPPVNGPRRYTRDVFQQGVDGGAAIFGRLEGAWFGNDRLFVTATSGGDAKMGQIWELDPKRARLRLLFESTGPEVLAGPDNVTLSRRGGLAICEDGPNTQRVQGLTQDGQIINFARNNIVLNGEKNGFTGDFRRSEFAGATYSPDGNWMFVNVWLPGITFAITGPWGRGML